MCPKKYEKTQLPERRNAQQMMKNALYFTKVQGFEDTIMIKSEEYGQKNWVLPYFLNELPKFIFISGDVRYFEILDLATLFWT